MRRDISGKRLGGKQMTYNEILKEIASGLTGDPEADTSYLKGKVALYQNHESAGEILPGIGKLMFEILPEEQKAGIVQSLQDDSSGRRMALDEVKRLMGAKDNEEALALMEGLVSEVEEMDILLHRDEESDYLCLRNRFEEILYKRLENPEKEVRRAPEEFYEVYLTFGKLLEALGRMDEAEAAFEKASASNPVAVEPLFGLADIYKSKMKYGDYLEVLKKCLKRSSRPEDIASCYRYLGFYYSENHNYELAIALYFASLEFEKDNFDAQIGLHYISEGTYSKISEPDLEKTRDLFEGKGLTYGAEEVVIEAALTAARQAASEGQYGEARGYFEMVYRLNQDEKVRGWIEELPLG